MMDVVPNASWLGPAVEPATPLISDAMQHWIGGCLQCLILIFGCLGLVTNAVNVLVFLRQGLTSDSCTVGLFSLAIADFLGCLTSLPQTFCRLSRWALTFFTFNTCSAYTSAIFTFPHVVVSRIICWLTVYLAAERCLAVLLPFHVKSLLTPKTAVLATASVYALVSAAYLSAAVHVRISWLSARNGSFAVFHMAPPGDEINYYLSLSFNTILNSVALFLIFVTTGLMTYKLKASIRFREKTSSQGQGQRKWGDVEAAAEPGAGSKGQGRREMEVLKTVHMVTALCLVCLSMSHIPGFVVMLLPGVTINGVNENLFAVVYYYKFLFDVINSSLNYFFYIRFSSRYKASFDQLFGKSTATNTA